MSNNNIVLVIDDVAFNIELLTDILRDKYKVMAALGGEKAFKLMENKNPDIVLLDVNMPDIDGFDILNYMKGKKELADIPVIFVTGEHDIQIEEKGLELGAVDYIRKPFNPEIVCLKIRNHLEMKLYRDNLEKRVYERTKQLEERTKELEDYADRLENLTEHLTASRDAIIMGMSLMSEIHDSVTGAHIERIKIFTKMLTDKMLQLYPEIVTEGFAEQVVLYSVLHDVGKVGIPDAILKKSGKLTAEEFEAMKNHTVAGADLLRKMESFLSDSSEFTDMKIAIEIAESHHEKFNGAGYPYGLAGEAIPLSARIVTMADIYDALRSMRSYKDPYSHEDAVEIILSGDGRTEPDHFDPNVLETFRIIHNEFKIIYDQIK